MSALLHCIITSIENDRVKENLKVWKDNSIGGRKRMETQTSLFCRELNDMSTIPCYVLYIDGEEFGDIYEDSYYGRERLQEELDLSNYEREMYVGKELKIDHHSYNNEGEKIIKPVFRMLIE